MILRRWLPIVVSVAILVALAWSLDLSAAIRLVTAEVLIKFVPPLLAYAAVTLALEARSLQRAMPQERVTPFLEMARIKAATYPLALVHLALGGAALAVLLRRRARAPVAESAGIVMLLMAADLGGLLLLLALGLGLVKVDTPALDFGLAGVAAAVMLGGLVVIRGPWTLGPLERFRQLSVLRAVREASLANLVEIGVLRLLFVASFICVTGSSLAAFGIHVPVGSLLVNSTVVAIVPLIPIAVAGLGTGQAAFVYFFREFGSPAALLACSLTLSAGIIVVRCAIGLLYASEFTREAYAATLENANE